MSPTETDIDTLELDVLEARTALVELAAWVRDFSARKHLQDSEAFRLEISLTEVVTNIADHAYSDDATDHSAAIFVLVSDEVIKAKVTDSGRSFNPLAVPPPNRPVTIKLAVEGGLGIGLVNHFVDDWSYERADGQNQLTLVFSRQKKTDEEAE
jgi:anti-sigma regulatory factor (Ser/Thr protein kinase)